MKEKDYDKLKIATAINKTDSDDGGNDGNYKTVMSHYMIIEKQLV